MSVTYRDVIEKQKARNTIINIKIFYYLILNSEKALWNGNVKLCQENKHVQLPWIKPF